MMARTFSYQKNHRNRKQPPLRTTWRVPPEVRNNRGPFAALADKVRQHREKITTQTTTIIELTDMEQPTD